MTTTHERIVQAEEGIAQVQSVLGHAQEALAVAEQVEEAAHKGRRLLKVLAILTLLGLVLLIIIKVTRRPEHGPELRVVDGPADDSDGAPEEQPPAS